MKTVKAFLAVGACALLFWSAPLASAQEETATQPEPAAEAAAREKPEKAEKPDIKELMANNTVLTNTISMELIKIDASLWVGKFEVTQSEYTQIAGANPSRFGADRNPVDSVSWSEAVEFCRQLTAHEKEQEMLPEGFVYTLPTQAQWLALTAGADLKDAVTSNGVSRHGPAAAGSLGANAFGLHDLRGNVWEWCRDPKDKPYRVLKGGAWDSFIEVTLRPQFVFYSNGPDDRKPTYGFRCILVSAASAN